MTARTESRPNEPLQPRTTAPAYQHQPEIWEANRRVIASADIAKGWSCVQDWLSTPALFGTSLRLRSLREKYAAIDVHEDAPRSEQTPDGAGRTPVFTSVDLEHELNSLVRQVCELCAGPGRHTETDSGWEVVQCIRCLPPRGGDGRQEYDDDEGYDTPRFDDAEPVRSLDREIARYRRGRPAQPLVRSDLFRFAHTSHTAGYEDDAFWAARLKDTPVTDWRAWLPELLEPAPSKTADGLRVGLGLLLHPDLTAAEREAGLRQWLTPPPTEPSHAAHAGTAAAFELGHGYTKRHYAFAEYLTRSPEAATQLPPETLAELLGVRGGLSLLSQLHPHTPPTLATAVCNLLRRTTGLVPLGSLFQLLISEQHRDMTWIAHVVTIGDLPAPLQLLARARGLGTPLTPSDIHGLTTVERAWLIAHAPALPLTAAARIALVNAEVEWLHHAVQVATRGEHLMLDQALSALPMPSAAPSSPSAHAAATPSEEPAQSAAVRAIFARCLAHPDREIRALGVQHIGRRHASSASEPTADRSATADASGPTLSPAASIVPDLVTPASPGGPSAPPRRTVRR